MWSVTNDKARKKYVKYREKDIFCNLQNADIMRNIKKTSIAQMKDKKEETKFLSAAATLTQAEQEQVGSEGIIVKYVIFTHFAKIGLSL